MQDDRGNPGVVTQKCRSSGGTTPTTGGLWRRRSCSGWSLFGPWANMRSTSTPLGSASVCAGSTLPGLGRSNTPVPGGRGDSDRTRCGAPIGRSRITG